MASQDHGIHSFEECVPKESDYFQQTLGRAHTRRSSTHNKRKEDDEAEIRSLPMKQIKISIQLSFNDIVLLCTCLYFVDVLCMIECLH